MSPFFVSSLPTRVTSHLSQHFVNQLNNLQLDSWTFWISQKVKLIKFDKKQIKTDYLCPSLHLSPHLTWRGIGRSQSPSSLSRARASPEYLMMAWIGFFSESMEDKPGVGVGCPPRRHPGTPGLLGNLSLNKFPSEIWYFDQQTSSHQLAVNNFWTGPSDLHSD